MYVPPVKLYIFVSFLTFFVFAFFPTIDFNIKPNPYNTQEDYDKGTKNKIVGLPCLQDAFAHKYLELKEEGVQKGKVYTKIFQTSFHNLPKALIIYLPIFAFFL